MYDCKLVFYFIGCPANVTETIKKVSPLPGFHHTFFASHGMDTCLVGKSDVIMVGPDVDKKALSEIIAAKKPNAEIVLFHKAGVDLPTGILEELTDIWQMPASDEMLLFHFSRWQKVYKQDKDLWETRQFLECSMTTTPNLYWFKNRDGVHELVNDNFCRTVNKTRDDVQGRKHAYIWNVEGDDPACIESERIVMESGKTKMSEEHIVTGQGPRILTTYKSPLWNVDGSVMGTIGIGIDVTQEREYRDRLLRNSAALENIFTTMDCGILCHTLDGRHIISVNRAALRLLGMLSKEELESSGFDMVASTVVEEDKPRLRAAIKQLKQKGDSANYAYRVAHADGRVLHVMGNARLVEKDGELICQRFLLDCTAQILAEEKERQEIERRQRELIRALSMDYQLVCVFNVDSREGTVLQLMDHPDRKLKEIFSGDSTLLEKLRCYADTCVHPDDRESFRSTIGALKEELACRKVFYLNYRSFNEGNEHYFQMKAVRTWDLGDSFGVVLGLQSVDLRTRMEMEQKTQLMDALKQAKKASNAKSIFLSNMSHDIRTPMNAIVGYTSLALKNIDIRDNVKNYLNKILASGNHLISLINDILDMSYIESGKIQLDEKLCELSAVLHELWNIVQPTANTKAQILSFEKEGVDTLIYCDQLRLKQLLLNLLSNSVKYTDAGGKISLKVSQFASTTPFNAVYEFRIKDNGIGMSEDFLKRIFEPFERAQNSTMAGIQGTGLGMAITKSIVEMMKGEIEVHSKPREGTEFIVRLPLRLPRKECRNDSQTGVDNAQTSCKETEEAGKQAFRTGRLLLAEDNEMNQEIACEFLTGAGYQVDVAANGKKAVEMLRKAEPGYYDVVLMDVQMPVLDGYGATQLIRSLPDRRLANIPIIAMTANSFEEDRREALLQGMNEHIAKPIDFKILFKTLDRLLS